MRLPRGPYLIVGVSDFHGDTEMRGVAGRLGIPGLQQEATCSKKLPGALFQFYLSMNYVILLTIC